ncbi:glycosyltransferase family 39 protein [Lachnospiraceae bacterium MD1]|uniref:Glycosyltransferase family 39 protein n=1 Tax=Variimorphobacter saccharofermentans TaxID=2755051 RepID=A0A839K4N8_9FIRM|nr:glycosyltransferase family 39 protein [Variimorphobacter saccharofermentans]MBB2184328.1 glycosyltransferase family 39 protein [Variimorphobacter saccharofermentans]
MNLKKNWFTNLAGYLYLAATALILIFGVTQFAEERKYPYLTQIILVIGFFVVLMGINMICYLITRPRFVIWIARFRKASPWIEAVLVILILTIGLILRIKFIKSYPVDMESDYKFYYDVARLIKNGTLLTESNNEYIALFPHTIGYAYVLSRVIAVFGTTPEVCLYFNAVLSVLTALFCYGIGKKAVGSSAGIVALILACFWPSQIIFSNINGAEAVFTFCLYGAAYLFVFTMKKYNGTNARAIWPILLHFLVGIVLGLASAIRPMSLVFLLAIAFCLIFLNDKLVYKKNINELPFAKIFLSKGWMRIGVLLAGYLLCGQIVTANISQAIQKNIASSGAMGYSLMVGLDREHDGGYSEKSMNLLYNTYYETESADEVNQICMDIAMESVKADPMGTVELLAKKFFLVWANDDYATTTNVVTMNNQGLLTRQRAEIFEQLSDMNNVYYLLVVFLSGVGVYFLLRKDNNTQIFSVFFIGAIVLHMLVEMQNRYHYYLLQNFTILASAGVGLLLQSYLDKSKCRIEELQATKDKLEKIVPEVGIPVGSESETVLKTMENNQEMKQNTDQNSIRKEELKYNQKVKKQVNQEAKKEKKSKSLLNTIDVLKAIEDGHIIITATKAYEDRLQDKGNREQGTNSKVTDTSKQKKK